MTNKYLYYILAERDKHQEIILKEGYRLNIHSSRLGSLNLHTTFRPIYLVWYFLTLGRCKIFYVLNRDGFIIHFSHVMPKIFKYSFMSRKNSLHIGPCWTHEDHRGNRIYPAVLSFICKKYNQKNLYIFTEKDNIPSQKGITRTGFREIGQGYKSKGLGIYRKII